MLNLGRAPRAITILTHIAGDDHADSQLRTGAVSALGSIGRNQDISEAIPVLLEILGNDGQPLQLRQGVTNALSALRQKPSSAIPALVKVIRESDEDQLRTSAISALGAQGSGSSKAAETLFHLPNDNHESAGVRATAAEALGRTGTVAKPYIGSLLDALKHDDTSSSALRGFIGLAEEANADGDFSVIAALRQAVVLAREKPNLANRGIRGENDVAQLQDILSSLQAQAGAAKKQSTTHILDLVTQHRFVSIPVIASLACAAWALTCLLLLLRRPITLIGISDVACSVAQKNVKIPVLDIPVPMDWLILCPSLQFHSRSLDAWLRRKIDKVRLNFANLPTVSERELYVDLAVRLDGERISRFGPESIRECLKRTRTLILVVGEGGSGKTSLACQIGRWVSNAGESRLIADHLMFPVLIEGDFAKGPNGVEQLRERIRGQMRQLLDEKNAPSKEMVEALLSQKRVLVIVDGFSEVNEASRAAIRPVDPSFQVHALLITSRQEETLPGVSQSTLQPERLAFGSVGVFIESYLQKSDRSGVITRQEFQDHAAALQALVGHREITPLFAKLYIDLLVSSKENKDHRDLPRSVPELVLHYLNHLNRKITLSRKEDYEVYELAMNVAWECVVPNLRPAPVRIETVLNAIGGPHAHEGLDYLQKRLLLVQALAPGEEVRFSLDPLAEYLAALRLMDGKRLKNEGVLRVLPTNLIEALKPGSPIGGFIQAVVDCYHYRNPGSVIEDDAIIRQMLS